MKNLFLIITAVGFVSTGLNASAADGGAIYTKHCANCHGADGKGDTKMGKKLKIKDLAAEQSKISDANIVKSIKDGIMDGDKVRMKPIKDLTDDEIQAVVKFVRTLKN